jgi:hypothetical protein
MRRRTTLSLGLTAALAATAFAPIGNPTDSPVVQLAAEVITSPNVEYLGTLPIDSPGVGGAVVESHGVTGQHLFYATGLKGMTIYDLEDPALPMPIGFLAFEHAQNEDLSISTDGTRAIISADGSILVPVAPRNTGVHVVDVSDPTAPFVTATIKQSNHTSECADAACDWLYGSSTAGIYDATRADEGIITRVEGRNYNEYTDANGDAATAGGRHASNLDASGLLTTDSNPRLVLDPRVHTGEDGTEYGPDNPEVLAIGFRNTNTDNRLQHNNYRPSANDWEPRDATDPADAYNTDGLVTGAPADAIVLPEGSLRPGELLVANSESNLNPTCNMAGGLSTWDMRDFDNGRAPVQLDVFKPVNGTWADGNPAANGLGCSGHWFSVQDNLVTASWYEHGVRFFDVTLDTGAIEEVGFFQPIATQAGAAYWVSDEIVYSVDYARGIDILRFDADGDRPTEDERVASWMANLGVVGEAATAERWFCQLAVTS